ncbi:hypothetical protein TCAL_07571 [Tigriopus californicus]|uniref:Serine protease HTRA2, mitochondrial n=1 Tax=Tigriopus californicus TaxID=6832 RepID=A0A553PKF4_TIGCA|nr:serine protease HTRA2, mitochondrial-like [Tigriopus californicus]TRY78162.1 hypothetical protein TCAL_07571 [Tigriopus californicus]
MSSTGSSRHFTSLWWHHPPTRYRSASVSALFERPGPPPPPLTGLGPQFGRLTAPSSTHAAWSLRSRSHWHLPHGLAGSEPPHARADSNSDWRSWSSRLGFWLSSLALSLASALFLAQCPRALRAAEAMDPSSPGLNVPPPPRKNSRRQSYNFIADVVQDVASALVYIEIKDLGVRDYFTGQPMTSSNGSGFIVQSDGLILTNAHVVINKPRASVQVRLQDGRTFTGVVENVDVQSDLATVRIPCQNLPVMPLGTSANVRPGEFVIAMGSPLSLSNTITTGVVSARSRARAELGLRDREVPEYIQTDAAITFGNSGGPLVNLDGEAIGINSMKVTPGISFAIPIDYAKEFLRKAADRTSRSPPVGERRYAGITFVTITTQILDDLRLRMELPMQVQHGIAVFRIVRGSPAHRAGLMAGDVVTHINGKPILTAKDFYRFMEGDDDLEMSVYRKTKKLKFLVQPEVL